MGMFKFTAFGILAVAALAFVLFSTSSSAEKSTPLFAVGAFIVIAFIIYMFAKLLMRG